MAHVVASVVRAFQHVFLLIYSFSCGTNDDSMHVPGKLLTSVMSNVLIQSPEVLHEPPCPSMCHKNSSSSEDSHSISVAALMQCRVTKGVIGRRSLC